MNVFENGPSRYLDDAVGLLRAGRIEPARISCTAMLVTRPEHAGATQLLALLLLRSGRAEDAARVFDRGTRLTPDDADAWSNAGAAARSAGRSEAATARLERALALAPDRAALWLNAARSLRTGRIAEAARAFGHVLRLAPADPDASAGLAELRAEQGPQLDTAARLLRLARAAPGGRAGAGAAAPVWAAAAAASWELGDRRNAEGAARRALDRDPAHPGANAVLGRVLLERSGLARIASGRPFDADGALGEAAIAALLRAGDDASGWTALAAIQTMALSGLADDRLVATGARAAWEWLRRHRKDAVAASLIAHHAYRAGRLPLASWLTRRFLHRFEPAKIAAEHELGIWSMLRADDAFHAALPPFDAIVGAMEPVRFVRDPPARPAGEPFALIACDDVYYRRFAPALLESIADRMPEATVVAHLVAPSPETRADLDRRGLAWSWEEPDMSAWTASKRPTYFASARFIRARQWQSRLGRPLIVLDTDATVLTDLRAVAAEIEGFDAGLLHDARRRGPSRETPVGFVYYAATAGGLDYLDRVARYIGALLAGDAVFWMLDQMAHHVVLDRMTRSRNVRVKTFDFVSFRHCRFVGAK